MKKNIVLLLALVCATLWYCGPSMADTLSVPCLDNPGKGCIPVSTTNPMPTTSSPSSPTTVTGNVGGYATANGTSTTLTRPPNTTAYASGEIICATTTAACSVQVTLARTVGGTMFGNRRVLLKSGSSTTNATFNLFEYSALPTLSGLTDRTAYVGPYAADVPNFLGEWICSVANLTSDVTAQVWYECVPQTPFAPVEQAVSGQQYVYDTIEVTGAYTPASDEVFAVYGSTANN